MQELFIILFNYTALHSKNLWCYSNSQLNDLSWNNLFQGIILVTEYAANTTLTYLGSYWESISHAAISLWLALKSLKLLPTYNISFHPHKALEAVLYPEIRQGSYKERHTPFFSFWRTDQCVIDQSCRICEVLGTNDTFFFSSSQCKCVWGYIKTGLENENISRNIRFANGTIRSIIIYFHNEISYLFVH